MRRQDSSLNATHIIDVARKSKKQRDYLLKIVKEFVKTDRVRAFTRSSGTWVSFRVGRILCRHLDVEKKLEPLLNYNCELQVNGHEEFNEQVDGDLPGLESRLLTFARRAKESKVDKHIYNTIQMNQMPIMIRSPDFRINCNQILKLVGLDNTEAALIRNNTCDEAFDIVNGPGLPVHIRGTYVDFQIGLELCRKYGLEKLEEELQILKSYLKGLAQESTSSKSKTIHQPLSPVRVSSEQGPALLQLSTRTRSAEYMTKEDQIRAEDTDSGSDTEGSMSFVKSHDTASIYVQPLPSASNWEYQSHRSCLTQVNPDLRLDSRNFSSQYGSFKTDVNDVWKNIESLE
jgi:hypothetical protein